MPNPKLETYKNKATGTVYDYTDAAAQAALADILDGTDIDSFSDVETALATKVDKVSGKGLSTNDYTNSAKEIVDNIQSNVIANTKLIKDTVGWLNENLIDVGNSVSDWFATSNNGLDVQSGDISAKVTAIITKATGSIAVSNYDSTGYWWMSKKVKLKKNTDYIFGTSSASTTIKLVGSNNGSTGTLINTFIEPKKINSGDYEEWWISIYPSNFSCSNLMARDARILDDSFEPYFGSTAFPRSEQAVLGAKNVAIGPFSSSSIEGIAYTANSDNTVGVVAGSTHAQHQVNSTPFTALVSGMFKYLGGIANEAVVFCWDNTSNSRPYTSPSKTTAQSNNSKGKEDAIPFYMEEGHVYQLICRVGANVEVTGTFYPMIICETDTDLSYTAPAMTNKELTDAAKLRTVTPTIDGTIVKTYKGGLVAYNLLTRVCTFGVRLVVGSYANYVNFMTGLPKAKSIYSFPCVCTNFARNVGMAVLTTSADGGIYFTGLGQAANFADGDELNISGSYIIADDVVS